MAVNSTGSLEKPTANPDVDVRHLNMDSHDPHNDSSPAKEGATAYDLHDMDALGLAPTFKRRFKFIAMVGFCSTVRHH